MRKTLFTITIFLFLLSGTLIPSNAQFTPNAVKNALNSIAVVEIDNIHGKTISHGLGFFISKNKVVTHLSEIADYTPIPKGVEIYVKLIGKRTRYFVNSFSVKDNRYNLAILDVTIPGLKPIAISDKTEHKGTVYTIRSLSEPKVVKGTVKGNSKYGDYIRVSNPISEKNIGSPLLNTKGEIIGIAMPLSELSKGFNYEDEDISISIGGNGNLSLSIRSNNTGNSINLNNTGNSINIGGSSFGVSSKVLKDLLAKPNRDLENSPSLRDITNQKRLRSNRIEKVFDVNPGGSLIIDTEFGDIDVNTTTQNKVIVEITKETKVRSDIYQDALDDFQVDFDTIGSVLSITGEFEHGRNRWLKQLKHLRIRFQVKVPRKFDVDLNTPSGDISIDDVTGELQARTSAGDVRIENAYGPVNAQTSAGDLRINTVKGSVFGRTSAGDISLTNCQGKVDAKTSAGDIRAAASTQPQHEWNLQTSAGDIVFTLISNLAAEIDAQTSVGSISSDFRVSGTQIRKKRVRGSINGGGKLLKLRTSVGDIKLKKR